MARVSLKKDFRDGDKLYGQQLNNNFGAIEAALDAMNKIVWQDDVDEDVSAFRGTTAELQEQPIIDGQLLYDISTGETYIDYNGERISTGSGNAIHIGSDTPENNATQIWIDPTEPVTNIGTEVVNNLDGDETHMAPSVHAIKSANTYSTEEVKTGDIWIDNKPIYRKVITANMKCNGALTHGIVNLDLITDLKIIFKQSNDNFVILPKNTVEKEYTIGVDKYTSSIIQLSCGSYFANNQNYDFTFIIEYTKTTDGSDS